MRIIAAGVCVVCLIVGASLGQNSVRAKKTLNDAPWAAAVEKGAKWLASVQGADGGWGQDGGETSYVRTNERLESNGNDVANTAAAVLALRRAGNQYQANIRRGL